MVSVAPLPVAPTVVVLMALPIALLATVLMALPIAVIVAAVLVVLPIRHGAVGADKCRTAE
jgi:hypothetical protein